MVPHLWLHPLLSVTMVSDVSGECLRWAREWMTVSRWVINHNKLYHCFCSLSNLYYTVPLSYHFHTAIMPWLPGCISECSIYGIYFKIYPKHDPNTGTYCISYNMGYAIIIGGTPQGFPSEALLRQPALTRLGRLQGPGWLWPGGNSSDLVRMIG